MAQAALRSSQGLGPRLRARKTLCSAAMHVEAGLLRRLRDAAGETMPITSKIKVGDTVWLRDQTKGTKEPFVTGEVVNLFC